MANQNLNRQPYFDDYDPTKGFKQVLALPGRVEQAREFTQIQSMFLDFLKRLGDTILKNGSVVEGCGLVIRDTEAIIGKGRIYVDGIVYTVEQSSVTITGIGKEVIGVRLREDIVTEVEDPTLRDPAQGYDNYNQAGAHRLRSSVEFKVNDETTVPVYTLQDGALLLLEEKPQLDVVSDLLARRTNDESGNYRVHGLTLFAEPFNDTHVKLTIEAGKAYVLGYEVTKPTPTKINIPKALETRTVLNEPKVYRDGTNKYKLNNKPVKVVTQVVAQVEVTENMTRGSVSGGIDYLPKTPVIQIMEVTQGGTTYVQGTNYQLTNDGVDWSLPGVEPSIGSTYTVKYRYNKVMHIGNDCILTSESNGTDVDYFIDFSPAGDNPVPDTTFTVDYEFYLARKDLISLQKDGNIKITSGQSDITRLISTPSNDNPDVLHLGTVYLPPNSSEAITNSYAVTRLRMEELQRIVKRVEDMEYNMALDSLDEEAMAGEAPTNLKGIFSDGFIGFTKADLTHPDYTAAMSIETGELVLPTSSIKASNLGIDSNNSTAKIWGRLITTPITERVAIEQIYATSSMLVNPYNVFNKLALLKVTPEVDNWVDTENSVIEKNATQTYTVHRWWYHGGDLWNDTERYLFNNLVLDKGQSWNGWDNITGTITSSTSKTILDEAILYMRQREVQVTGTNLIPYSDNLELFFDGVRVPVTPIAPTSAGTQPGTLKAGANGEAKGKFTIPAGVRCGTREVALRNANNTSAASYTANGRRRVVEETVLRTRVTVYPYDPLAQSFQFDRDQVVSSVGLYFAAKDPANNVTIQIRNMVNGYPGQVIYAEKVVAPANVNVSTNGSVETKVLFDDPVVCKAGEQYCVVVVTDSDIYSLFVGELGKQDIRTGAFVTRQPYLAGTLFSSANAITWTAHQTQDMKFKVYTCEFAPTGTIEFNDIDNLGADRIILMADYLTPANTGCTWEIKLNNGSWQPIGNFEDKDISSVANKVRLRATFKADVNISPILASDSFSLISFLTATSGAYVSRNVGVERGYTTVRQVIEAHIPSGCSVVPKFTTDGTTWVTGTLTSTEPVNQDYTRFTYEHTLGASATNFRAKVEITAPNQLARPRARRFMNIMK